MTTLKSCWYAQTESTTLTCTNANAHAVWCQFRLRNGPFLRAHPLMPTTSITKIYRPVNWASFIQMGIDAVLNLWKRLRVEKWIFFSVCVFDDVCLFNEHKRRRLSRTNAVLLTDLLDLFVDLVLFCFFFSWVHIPFESGCRQLNQLIKLKKTDNRLTDIVRRPAYFSTGILS